MTKPTKTLVPKLRFPEFQNVGQWDEEPLGELYAFKVTNSLSRDKLNYAHGAVKNIHYGDIHTKFSSLFDIQKENVPFINPTESLEKIKQDCYCIEGDMIFADASEDLEDIGKSIEIVNLNNERLLSGLHTLLARQKSKKLIIGFGGHLFKSKHIRKQIQKESQGSKVLGISAGRLSDIEVCYPLDKNEQQKIADCLSSIDELITAQTKKIAALKDHKKGLMQQLFPLEGETVPKLRFSEFQDSGGWNEEELTKFSECELSNGVFNDPKKVGSGYKLINVLDMFIDTVVDEEKLSLVELSKNEFSKNKVETGDIFFTRSSLVKSGIAYSNIYVGNSCDITFDGHLIRFRPNKNILIPMFANYLLRTTRVRTQLVARGKTATMTTIGQADVGGVKLTVPDINEQQKIAACLTSVDNLITEQTQKIEAYKAHKKGLMQRLFPIDIQE